MDEHDLKIESVSLGKSLRVLASWGVSLNIVFVCVRSVSVCQSTPLIKDIV